MALSKITRRTRQTIAVCLALLANPLQAAPSADLWEYWQTHDEQNTERVSHWEWQWFLDHFVVAHPSGINRVDYAMVDGHAQRRLQEYIDRLSAIDPRTLNRDQQFAYWVNLYNVTTVMVIAKAYPVTSILETGEGWFRRGPWRDKLLTINEQAVSLDDIEHRILRPIWQDHRIHFVVNCASIGCPNLPRQAISADTLDAQLDQAAQSFLRHERAFAIRGDILHLSSIFDWYGDDFGSNQAKQIATIAQYLPPEQRKQMTTPKRIKYHYDWGLNDLP